MARGIQHPVKTAHERRWHRLMSSSHVSRSAEPLKPGDALSTQFEILLADDDGDDRGLAQEALWASGFKNEMRCVVDGQDLLDYLRHDGRWTGPFVEAPRPAIILLDLNMPKKDGREALAEIKADESLCRIPVVVLAGLADKADVLRAYDLGASAFISKRYTFHALVDVMRIWARYWFETVDLPIGDVVDFR